MLQEISFKALPASLVEKIELDVGDLKIGDTIRVKDLVIAKDENIDLITDLDSTVVTVTEPRVSTDVTSETERGSRIGRPFILLMIVCASAHALLKSLHRALELSTFYLSLSESPYNPLASLHFFSS